MMTFTHADMVCWKGRVDAAEGPRGRRWHQQIAPLDEQTEGVALIGFCSDAGVIRNLGRPGAAEAPDVLRRALANLPVRSCRHLLDAGDVVCVGYELEAAQQSLSLALAGLLDRGLLPLTLGGGHEVAFGSFGGLAMHLAGRRDARHLPAPRIGVVNLDAHLDLRQADRASSGTPFRQIAEECERRGWPFHYCCLGVSEFANTPALFDRAEALGATWLCDEEMGSDRLGDTLAVLDNFLCEVDHVYLTICLDVLPASVAPGVSAPSARGVDLSVIEALVDGVTATGKVRLADIAELNPHFDTDGRTARVGARLVGRIVEGVWQRQSHSAPWLRADR
jgi:formiminoglutamase